MPSTIIRIKEISISNFKNVRNGKLSLTLQSTLKDKNFDADILALYGPNGSGKSALIDALAILKNLISGKSIPSRFAASITQGAAFAELCFTLALLDETTKINQEAVYSIKITSQSTNKNNSTIFNIKPILLEEKLAISGSFNNSTIKLQPLIFADCENKGFSPTSKHKYLLGDNKETLTALEELKHNSFNNGQSFIFADKTTEIFNSSTNKNDYLKILERLHNWAITKLCIITNISAALMASQGYLALSTPTFDIALATNKPNRLAQEKAASITEEIAKINRILPLLVQDMQIQFQEEQPGFYSLYARHRDMVLPLCLESSGTLKIIASLNLLFSVFNEADATIVIDELDENLFEYMLGKLLNIIQMHGKGQLIFTAHQLTPLGLLDRGDGTLKKSKAISVAFTSTNPGNKYIRIKNMCNSNNLKDVYLKLIKNTLTSKVRKEQDEQLYNIFTDEEIINALKN